MKRIYPIVFFLSCFCVTRSQVAFCPPGAEWHYLFSGSIFFPGNSYNEQIKHIGDSVSGQDTIKILSHYRFFLYCSPPVTKTYIKQRGDTVFLKNSRTQGTWQILYNFAAQPGQSWQTTILKSGNTPVTYTFTVSSVQQIVVNGFNLRSLLLSSGLRIVERFGSDNFLFNYIYTNSSCDGNGLMEFLCYQDSTFGINQFGSKPCDYREVNSLGILEDNEEEKIVEFYPNPAKDILKMKNLSDEPVQVSVRDSYGKELQKEILANETNFSLEKLAQGIYFVIVLRGNQVVHTTKFVKE